MSIKLDLRQFKHAKSDGKTTTLQHKEGHTLTLAHGALSKEAQAQLEALAKTAETPLQKDKSKDDKRAKMAKGGGFLNDKDRMVDAPIKQPAEVGLRPSKTDRMSSQQSNAAYEAAMQRLRDKEACGGEIKMAEGGDPAAEAQDAAELAKYGRPGLNDIETSFPTRREGLSPAPEETIGDDEFAGASLGPGEKAIAAAGFKPLPVSALNPSATPTVDEDTAGIRSQYDKLAGMRYQNTGVRATFGPNGEPPEKVDADLVDQAKAYWQKEKQDKQQAAAKIGYESAHNDSSKQALGLSPATPAASTQAAPMDVPTAEAVASPQAPQAPAGAPGTLPDLETLANQAYGKGQQAIAGQVGVEEQLGKDQAAANQKALSDKVTAEKTYQDNLTALQTDLNHYKTDIQNGYIDPNKYWTGYTAANGDTVPGHSKVAAAIGMILAGFNPTGSPNAAVDMLKFQMEQSLHSQAKNLDSSQNLFKANLEHFKDVKDAADMTRVMMNEALQLQLGQAAATAKTAGAKSAALAAQAKLAQDMMPIAQTLAMRRTLTAAGGLSGNPAAQEQMLNQMMIMAPEQYKLMAPKFMPGMGFAAVDLSPENKKALEHHTKFDAALNDLEHFVKTHTTINPYSAEYTTGEQKAEAVRQAIREAKLGGVYKEGEKPLLEKFLADNPAGIFKGIKSLPQIKELRSTNLRDTNNLKTNLGGDLARSVQHQAPVDQKAAAQAWLAANPTHPNAPKVKKILGIK